MKDLTSSKQGRTTTIQDNNRKRLTEDKDILNRWTEYCSELYSHKAQGDPEVFKHPPVTNTHNYSILQEEVEAAVKSFKPGKSADLADRRMAYVLDSVTGNYSSKERRPAKVSELSQT